MHQFAVLGIEYDLLVTSTVLQVMGVLLLIHGLHKVLANLRRRHSPEVLGVGAAWRSSSILGGRLADQLAVFDMALVATPELLNSVGVHLWCGDFMTSHSNSRCSLWSCNGQLFLKSLRTSPGKGASSWVVIRSRACPCELLKHLGMPSKLQLVLIRVYEVLPGGLAFCSMIRMNLMDVGVGGPLGS